MKKVHLFGARELENVIKVGNKISSCKQRLGSEKNWWEQILDSIIIVDQPLREKWLLTTARDSKIGISKKTCQLAIR